MKSILKGLGVFLIAATSGVLHAQSDSIQCIPLFERFTVHFNTKQMYLSKDDTFFFLKAQYPRLKKRLIHLVNDTTFTPLVVCYKDKPLRRGDIAFMLLNEFEHLNLAKILENQLVLGDLDCLFVFGVYDVLEKERERVVKRLLKSLR